MKLILILLATLLLQQADAQKNSIIVTAQNQTLKVNLQDENPEKVIAIKSTLKSATTGKLTITNTDWIKDKDWKRSFEIYDNADQSIAKVAPTKTSGKYEVLLKTLTSKMKKGETYSLYTIAIPRDPKKAAVVRVRRVLVCSISFS
jgi:hypothetical protein